MSEIIQPLIQPSYDLGNIAYGPEDALHPELWEGLVGYWDPLLGPTGLTLFDHSPGKPNNGQLTNMVAADAWIVGERGWVNAYDGGDDFVNIVPPLEWSANEPKTATVRLKTSAITGTFLYSGNAALPNIYLFMGGGGHLQSWMRNTLFDFGGVLNDGIWHHVAYVYDGSVELAYLDGQRLGSANSETAPAGNQVFKIGETASGAENFGGQIGTVSIYNRALLPNEIQLMAAGATPAMLAEDVVLKAPSVGLLLKQSNMNGGMENLSGGFV